MAFFRRRGNSLTLIHGHRTAFGVRQKVLHTFSNAGELQHLFQVGGWPKFCLEIEQKFPEVAPDWEEVKRQALELQDAGPVQEPDSGEQLTKLRRALAYASRELARLNCRCDRDRKTALALGPDLKNCLFYGQILVETMRGRTREEAIEETRYVVPNDEHVAGLVEEAQRALSVRKWKRAALLFEQARNYDPFDPDTLNSEGIGWLERGRLQEARGCFEGARDLAFSQLPQGDRVYSWSNLRARPYLRATYNLGLTAELEHDYQRALDLFQDCLQRCPDDGVSARFHVGSLHHRLGQSEAALRYYRQALEGNRIGLADPHFDGACVLLELGREREALEWIMRGLSINDWVPKVLNKKVKADESEAWTADSFDWACDYARRSSDFWTPAARAFLRRVVKEKSVRSILQEIRIIADELEEIRPSPERSELVRQLFSLRERLIRSDFISQVTASLGL